MFGSRCLLRTFSLAVLLGVLGLTTAQSVRAWDGGFDTFAGQIESIYHVRRTHIPMLWVASVAVKFVHPAGVKGFKFASFSNGNFTGSSNTTELNAVMRQSLGKQWQPLIAQQSRRTGERTIIYTKPAGKDIELMLASFSAAEGVLVQVKVSPAALGKWLDNPGQLGHNLLNGFPGDSRSIARNDSQVPAPAADEEDDDTDDDQSTPQSRETAAARRVRTSPTASESAARVVSQTTSALRSESIDQKPALKTAADMSVLESSKSAPPPVAKSTDPDSIKLEGRLVNLNVRATDHNGRIIPGLKKEDFQVYEDGVQQEIAFFSPNTAPVNLVLLLDLSTSTKDKTKVMKNAAKKFVDSLNPDDRIAVAVFTRRFTLISSFTRDHKLLKDRIGKMKNRGSGTAYYDAMWATLDLLDEVKEARKAVVVLSDGVDNSIENARQWPTKHDFEQLLGRASEEDATIYPIYLDTEYDVVVKRHLGTSQEYAVARKQLDSLAEMTGGVLFKAARMEDLNGVYPRVAAELHTLYSMAYSPNSPAVRNQWRKLTVKVGKPGTVARTRRGYQTQPD